MPVEVPRHLWYTDALMRPGAGRIVEAGDPEAAVLMAPAGMLYTEEEAKRLGITEYLEAHPDVKAAAEEVKAVPQAKVEDKAVAGPDETKADEEPTPEPPPEGGVSFPAESRRTGTRRPAS